MSVPNQSTLGDGSARNPAFAASSYSPPIRSHAAVRWSSLHPALYASRTCQLFAPRAAARDRSCTGARRMPTDHLSTAGAYLAVADHGIVGNGVTVALAGVDSTIDWCCLPHLDSPSVFGAPLDAQRGGCFRVAPPGRARGTQWYASDTNVLVTCFDAAGARVTVTDFMPVRGHIPAQRRLRPLVGGAQAVGRHRQPVAQPGHRGARLRAAGPRVAPAAGALPAARPRPDRHRAAEPVFAPPPAPPAARRHLRHHRAQRTRPARRRLLGPRRGSPVGGGRMSPVLLAPPHSGARACSPCRSLRWRYGSGRRGRRRAPRHRSTLVA